MAKRDRSKFGTDTGRIVRPEAVVLTGAVLLPPENRVKPAPNRFTHETTKSQPYFFDSNGTRAAGEFAAGTRVVLMVYTSGKYCRVIDGQGLYVRTDYAGLRPL